MMWALLLILIIAIAFIPLVGDAFAFMTAAAFIYLGGMILSFLSWLLDQSLLILVKELDQTIFQIGAGTLGQGISDVWKVFRDIANILIIGMFTFTAIAMILGIQNFNARKMVARVLIIAILINFSMLFTRVVVASTNFVATAFYQAMNIDEQVQGQVQSDPGTAPSTGLGGRFMILLGFDKALSWDRVDEVVTNVHRDSDSGKVLTIAFGFTVFVLTLATAFIFAYIVFLLIARTILIVFLLTTSALAFAAYLVPKWGDQYWSMWWNSLLRSAAIAPLLIVMLYATFIMARSLSENGANTSGLASLFTQGSKGPGVKALLFVIVILGMLFAAARFAQSFAKSIPGFNVASMLPAGALAIGDRIYGAFGRRFFGGYNVEAARRSEKVRADAAARAMDTSLSERTRAKAARIAFREQARKERYEARADRTYQLGQTETGKALFKALNAPGAALGGAVVTEKARQEKIAREAAEFGAKAAKASLSEKAQDLIKENAAKDAAAQHDTEKTNREGRANDAAGVGSSTAAQTRRADKQAQENARKAAEAEREMAKATMEQLVRSGNQAQARIEADKMTAADDRIRRATESLKQFDDEAKAAKQALEDHEKGRDAAIEQAGKAAVAEAVKRSSDALVQTTQKLAGRRVWSQAPLTAATSGVAAQAREMAAKGLKPEEQQRSWLEKLIKGAAKDINVKSK